MITDDGLRSAVGDELAWDPTLDSKAIAVSAKNGVVTLRGTVESFLEKCNAKWDAERVYGVVSVDDDLIVELPGEVVREDVDVRGTVLQALMLNSLVPSTIDARVDDGWVTLSGSASWQYQRDEAQRVAAHIGGVYGVTNNIDLVPSGPSAADVREKITEAMERNARLDASNVSVTSSEGRITLTGVVSSWAEHDEAVNAAWASPGVVNVIDDLRVSY